MAYVSEKKAKQNQQDLLLATELLEKYAENVGLRLGRVYDYPWQDSRNLHSYVSQMHTAGVPNRMPVWSGDGRICCVCQVYAKHGINMVKVPTQLNLLPLGQLYRKYDVVKCAAAGCHSMLERE